MKRRHWVVLLGGLWAVLYAASFVVAWYTAASGDGFTRGLNRVMVFGQYQIGAGMLAVPVWWLGRTLPRRWQRWLARAPALLAVALLVLIAGAILAANLNKPGRMDHGPDPDRPVSAPAKSPAPVAE